MNKALTLSHTTRKATRNRGRYPLLSVLVGVVILVGWAVSASAPASAAGATLSQASPMSAAQLAAITGSDITSPKSPVSPMSPEAAESQDSPEVAYNSTDDEYLVVWADYRNGATTSNDIYGQRVSVDGALLSSPFPISTATDDQDLPTVAYNSTDNQYLVVWEDRRPGDYSDIYGQRLSAAGTLLGTNFPISTAARDQRTPAVAYNSTNNEFLVVWHDLRPRESVGGDDIYGQRVSGVGGLLGGEILISTITVRYRETPAVAYNSTSNEFLVVWDTVGGGSGDCLCIYGRRVSFAGALLGGEFPIQEEEHGSGPEAYGPDVAHNSTNNEYLVVWDTGEAYNSNLYGRRVSSTGALLGADIPISIHESVQLAPDVAYNSTNNEYLVAWHDLRNDAPDIYGQRVSATGTLLGGDFPISTAASDQTVPAIAYTSTGNGYLVVWQDYRDAACGSSSDIYGQRVSGGGALSGSNFNITPDPVCTLKFADVPPSGEGSTFYTFIRLLTCKGIVSGYACGGPGEACNAGNDPYYRPGANVTRGQLSKIIANSAGLSAAIPEGQQQFADIPPDSPFYEFVERLSQTGAISGYSCGGAGEICDAQNRPFFRPNNPATRGQISKIVATAAGFEDEIPPDQQTFTDVPPDSPFWVYIERLVAWEVLSGYNEPSRCPTGTPCFRYNDNTTRGQMAKIAANAFFPGCQAPTRP